MNVTEAEARRLLAAVKEASERARASRAQADADSAVRRRAVQACMDAGIPRQQIADALGVSRQMIYVITSPDA